MKNELSNAGLSVKAPIAVDDEQWCLGLAMVDPTLVSTLRQHCDPEDFYLLKHQHLSEVIYRLSNEGVDCDPVAVITALRGMAGKDMPTEDDVLTIYDSAGLLDRGVGVNNMAYHAKNIREVSERRMLIRLLGEKYDSLLDPTFDDMEGYIWDLVDQVFRIRRVTGSADVYSELGAIMKLLEQGDTFGISTGFSGLDRICCGYQKGELYVLGGRPAMGKTALALKLARNLCEAGKSVMLISLEMPLRQLLLRLLSMTARVPYRCFRQREALPEVAWPRVVQNAGQIATWNFCVDDSSGISVEQIVAKVEQQHYHKPLDLVIVDHMHLIPSNGYGSNNAEAYSHISLMLKNLARRLDIPVVCLAQLNRGLENRPDKRPRLSDLRESGGIEQNADNVWLLYREEYYAQDGNVRRDSIEDVELIVAKNKSLETGTVMLQFKGAFMEFDDKEE